MASAVLDNLAEESAANLPAGYMVTLRITRHTASVTLIDPCGDTHDFDDGLRNLAGQVVEAVKWARRNEGKT